jgi:hypothetical protein
MIQLEWLVTVITGPRLTAVKDRKVDTLKQVIIVGYRK